MLHLKEPGESNMISIATAIKAFPKEEEEPSNAASSDSSRNVKTLLEGLQRLWARNPLPGLINTKSNNSAHPVYSSCMSKL